MATGGVMQRVRLPLMPLWVFLPLGAVIHLGCSRVALLARQGLEV